MGGCHRLENEVRSAGALRWHFEQTQEAHRRRHIDERLFGVPEGLAVRQPADRLAVFDDVSSAEIYSGSSLAAGGFGFDPVLLRRSALRI